MKKLEYLPVLLVRLAMAVGLTVLMPSCSKQDAVEPATSASATADSQQERTQTFYGRPVQMGQGIGRAWVTIGAYKQPLAIGLEVSARAALNQGSEPTEYTFQLPRQVQVPPFDHIELGWNPSGHEPDGIYTLPHFDLHAYLISSAAQATIPFLAPPAFDTPLAARYVAPAYIQTPGLVPNMGAHWVDVLSDEFQPGGVFTKTFIYGSYAGNLTFLEPMFTSAYLRGQRDETTPIRQPQAFQRGGFYPGTYTISYDEQGHVYRIALDNLAYHAAQ